jgi:hypothetical protein
LPASVLMVVAFDQEADRPCLVRGNDFWPGLATSERLALVHVREMFCETKTSCAQDTYTTYFRSSTERNRTTARGRTHTHTHTHANSTTRNHEKIRPAKLKQIIGRKVRGGALYVVPFPRAGVVRSSLWAG